MTTRHPRSRVHRTSATSGGRAASAVDDSRSDGEPTDSLSLGPDEPSAEIARPTVAPESLALGTAVLPARSRRRLDVPDDYIGGVLGSYRVLALLGKGGMGYVFRAEHVKLGREVALKLLRSDYTSRRDAVSRFFQEARTVNRVRHRNIVDVTDFVELDDGTTYIIMELLTGTSLGVWARSGVDLPRALAVLVQICDGLGAAHQVGVIHRDLKPDNVIVVPTADGTELVKLLDFGVAKLLNRDGEDVGLETAVGSVVGTPAYMSPEQAGAMVIDARSDIYSLGAIMYEMFCGQPMFRGRSFGEYVRKHLTEAPVPPRQTPGGAFLAPALEAVILRCLDKDPDQRFTHIGELRQALLALLARPASLAPRGPAWSARPWARFVGGTLVVALGGIAAFWLAGAHEPEPARSTAEAAAWTEPGEAPLPAPGLHTVPPTAPMIAPAIAPSQADPPTAPSQADPPNAPSQAAPPNAPSQAAPPNAPSQATPPNAPSQATPPNAPSQAAPPNAPSQAAPPNAPSQATPPNAPSQAAPPNAPSQAAPPNAPSQATPPNAPSQATPPNAPSQATPPNAPSQATPPNAPPALVAPEPANPRSRPDSRDRRPTKRPAKSTRRPAKAAPRVAPDTPERSAVAPAQDSAAGEPKPPARPIDPTETPAPLRRK